MSTNLNFLWLDDNPKRYKDAENMATELSANINFIGLKDKKPDEELLKILSIAEPDLVLMDHSLEQAENTAIRSGSSAAAIIREKWQYCPIVAVTATDLADMDTRHRLAYEEIFQITCISKKYSKIKAIAEGFRAMKSNPPLAINDILKYLTVPEDEREKMTKVFPRELKENFHDKSLLLEIYRWCEFTLFKRPGFLYDRLWVSTLLGLNLDGFKQVEIKFESAKYQGVFANDSTERWWRSEVLSILGAETIQGGLPWVLGRVLVNDNRDHFSHCFSSHEEFPETVAAVDETPDTDWQPMKLKHTDPHPFFEDMLFFDELRIMKGAK